MATLSENKRIAKNTLYLYLRMVVLLVVGLYTSRVTLIALGISDYGIYNVVGGIVTMFVFINYAMINSTQRYFTYELGKGNTKQLSLIFSTSINIHIIISIIIILLSETIGLWFLYNKMVIPENRMVAAFWIFQFSIVSCAMTVISAPYNALIIAHEKMAAFAYISLVDAFLKLVIVLYLLHFGGDRLVLYGALILLISLFDFLLYIFYCNRQFIEAKYKYVKNKPLMREMLSFAGWNLFGNLAYICYTQGLNILLNIFFNPVVNAARGVAVQVQNVVSNFSYNVENAIKPQITKSYANSDKERMNMLMSVSARMSFYVLWIISLPLLFEVDQVLNLWLEETPDHTANFVRLTLLILMVDSMTGPLLTVAQATGNVKQYQLTVSSLCLLILPLSYVFLMYYKIPEIVFVINLTVFILTQFAKLFVVGRQINISKWLYFKEVFMRSFGVVLVSSLPPLLVWNFYSQSFLRLVLVCVVCIICVPLVIYIIGITSYERSYVNKKIKTLVKSMAR